MMSNEMGEIVKQKKIEIEYLLNVQKMKEERVESWMFSLVVHTP